MSQEQQSEGVSQEAPSARTTTKVVGQSRPTNPIGPWKDITAQAAVKTVALVGHAPSTRDMAPFKDGGVEVWTMNDAFAWIPRATRWFEIHERSVYDNPARRTAGYIEHLANFHGPVYMQYPDPRIPNAVPFDMAAMQAKYGTVFGSSFAWMIALAIEEGFKRIELYGCDLASATEYEEQRESTTYWIGMARGLGIDFYLPLGCPLLTRPSYGLPVSGVLVSREVLDNRFAQMRKQQGDMAAQMNAMAGRIDEFSFWRSVMEGKIAQPGVQLPPLQPQLQHPANGQAPAMEITAGPGVEVTP